MKGMTNPEEVLAHCRNEWERKVLRMEAGQGLDELVELEIFGRTYSMYLNPKPYSSDLSETWIMESVMSESE